MHTNHWPVRQLNDVILTFQGMRSIQGEFKIPDHRLFGFLFDLSVLGLGMGLETALRGSVVVKGYCKDGISRGGMQISVLISMFWQSISSLDIQNKLVV